MEMKIAIPTDGRKGLEDFVAGHFGRCKTYTILSEKGNIVEIIPNTSEHMGGKGLLPELLKKHKVSALLCSELGPRALSLCNELEIEVHVTEAKTVKEIFEKWKNGKTKKADPEDVCEEHKI
jgi:predicted Fe-Mo cluster-binding NifX family protein